MISFTLYCFAKVFNLSYTGATSRMSNFFHGDNTADALTKVVCGKTDGQKYAERIDVENPRAVNTLKSVSTDRLRFVYQSIIKEHPEGKSKEELISPLLEYALLQDKEIQADVYKRKDSDEVKLFIDQLRHMSLYKTYQNGRNEPQSNECNLMATVQENCATNNILTNQMATHDFFDYVEQNFDEVSSLSISCHAGDVWLRPSSYRYRLLKRLSDIDIPIHVIINSLPATEVIWQYMRDKEAYAMGMYRSVEDITKAWSVISSSRNNICVRVCDVPFLHNSICFQFRSDVLSLMRVGLYTYGKPLEESHPHLYFTNQDEHFHILQKEFEYLWSISKPINLL